MAVEAQTRKRGAGRWAFPAALAWSAGVALLALAWAAEVLPHPFSRAGAVNIGAVLNAFDPVVGSAFMLALGALGTACGAVLVRAPAGVAGRAASVTALLIAGMIVLVPMQGALLTLLGYTPVVIVAGWAIPGLPSSYVEYVTSAENLFLVYCALGAVLWGVSGLVGLRLQRDACTSCGRAEGRTREHEERVRAAALRTGRIAVAVAVASSLVYPSIRIPWLFGYYPGLGGEEGFAPDTGTLIIGMGLASGAMGGAVLMLGLVQRWGVRFPRWMVGLAGRRVPVSLAVVPATLVALALVSLGKVVLAAWLTGRFYTASAPGGVDAVHEAAFGSMLVWGAALAVATGAYWIRRRAECTTCGEGFPESFR
ncbi:hypothetical protein O4J56_13700 [Nocardiopsis sp. RSe5-2]|uniref:Uncharacterized protein n=1 Tax=Nocardiopsis endophytica TaxID=3018445 RepID=A0ABT4U426_9ACTN|nr:hypothetical protein [Nocardiopsis endophytica]MDA2811690.1 hypothetical protein [Nocardiopsis endophytica]